MKKLILGCVMFLGACEAGGTMAGSPGMQERLVIGNRSMTFEQCRARGGLIIRDEGSPMIACDPSVRGDPVPADELSHPDA